jgi:uracil-DNA glycosylase family 4
MNDIPLLQFTDLVQRIRACERCECAAHTTQRVPGIGPKDAKLVVLARNPGENEDKKGEPLVGKSGVYCNRILERLGFRRDEVGLMNVMCCFTEGNRQPYQEEVRQCAPFREEQLGWFEDKRIVLAMGREAIEATIGAVEGKLEDVIGILHRPTAFKVRGTIRWGVIPLYHPSYLMRDPKVAKAFGERLPAIKDVVDKVLRDGVSWGQVEQGRLFDA